MDPMLSMIDRQIAGIYPPFIRITAIETKRTMKNWKIAVHIPFWLCTAVFQFFKSYMHFDFIP